MRFLIEIATQNTKRPTKLGNSDNPDETILIANGFRWADDSTIPAVQDGYERSPVRWGDAGDGINAVAVYEDTLKADRLASEYAADLAENGPRYVLENQYIILCDVLRTALGGQAAREKLGFDELPTMMLTLKAGNHATYEQLRDAMDMINSALIRYDVRWWDTAMWHSQPELAESSNAIMGMV